MTGASLPRPRYHPDVSRHSPRTGSGLLQCAAAMALGAAAAGCGPDAPGGELTVLSWGGRYEDAVRKAMIEPFAEARGIDVRIAAYSGGLSGIREQVETGRVRWDVVELETFDTLHACEEGLLAPVPVNLLPPAMDGSPAIRDFAPGTLTRCGVGMSFYSAVVAYHEEHLGGREKPTTFADYFDLERFPGPRGMRPTPQINLEFALLADGVPRDEVYAVLAASGGVDRAFRKLDTIRDHIVWYEESGAPPRMLAAGDVALTTAFNGRIFLAQVEDGAPLVILWDTHILETSQWAVISGARSPELALEFIRFASAPESMARLGGYMAYSPVRASGRRFVTTHPDSGIDMTPHLPTSPQHAEGALHSDAAWWSRNLIRLNERFEAWRTGS